MRKYRQGKMMRTSSHGRHEAALTEQDRPAQISGITQATSAGSSLDRSEWDEDIRRQNGGEIPFSKGLLDEQWKMVEELLG